MNKLALMTGIDIPIIEMQLAIHQPTIKEISYLGEEEFFSGISCLCIDKNLIKQDKSLLENSTNFQIFMAVIKPPEGAEKRQQILSVLTLLFPDCKPTILPRSILLTKDGEVHTLDDSNFEALQKVIRSIVCFTGGKNGLPEYNPKSQKAKEIAEKLMRGRQKVAEQNAKSDGGSTLAQYLSVITVGISSMSLNDAMNLTIYQLYDLVERYSRYINWDIDIRSRLAGAKGESQIDNWMDDKN